MKKWLTRLAFLLAIGFVIMTVVNASWLADTPRGSVKLIAHRGVAQVFDRTGVENDTCTATRIEQPVHDYLENTGESTRKAGKLGAAMIEVDIAPTSDGKLVAFHDWTLDCRTDGKGPVREASLDEIMKLDAGHGYTADGGKTFPLRGTAVGGIQPLSTWLQYVPHRKKVMFNFKSKDAAEADMLAEVLKAADRDPVKAGDAFYGDAAPVARIRELYPDVWAWSPAAAKQCTADYVKFGWTGIIPESCNNGTMVIPINRQWMFWGWPDRLIARMEEVNAEIIVTGPYTSGEPNTGLTLPKQLGEIPRTFNGYVWVEDIWVIGPSLFPSQDNRSQEQIDAAFEGLERRRAAQ